MRLMLTVLAYLALAGPAAAQAATAPIRQFDLKTTELLGRAIFRQDAAAWAATDALAAKVPDLAKAGVKGWIVEGTGDVQKVRFLRDMGKGLEAGYDVEVGARGETRFSEPAERALAPEEVAAFTARQTAAGQVGAVCRQGYNTVVLHDPERPQDWLVWLLAPMPAADAIPVGGHYRFSVSADGRTVLRRDALSASCMVLPPPDPAKGKPELAVVTHVVSPTPVETHVFVQIQSGRPLAVAAGEHLWLIVDGQITDRGALKDLRTQSK